MLDDLAGEREVVGVHAGTNALPVAIVAAGAHAGSVRAWAEGVLGWQPVERGEDRLVPPALEVRDLDSPPPRPGDVPSLLLVDDGADGERVARIAARTSPDAVLSWPSGRDRLEAVAHEVLARRRPNGPSARCLRVGGSAGGVGTTTVTLALAGLTAWSGSRTLVALHGTGLPFRGLPAAALAAPDLWSRADPVLGVADLRAAVVTDRDRLPDVADATVDAVLLDVGVDADVDVLVCRPDAAALAALPATTAAAVVIVGDGPAAPRELRRLTAGRHTIHLDRSQRVSRAGLHGRVPAALPGAWLARLAPLVPGGATAPPPARAGRSRSSRRAVHNRARTRRRRGTRRT